MRSRHPTTETGQQKLRNGARGTRPSDHEPVLKLAGGLRRGILAVAKAALAARSAPQRAVRNEPTPATGERPDAQRVFGQKAVWHSPCSRMLSELLRRGRAQRLPHRAWPSALLPENRPL